MHVLFRDLVHELREKGRRCTFLGIGPVTLNVIKAAFEACVRCQCPPIFIASRNQVDSKSLGHGYLMGGMDQSGFVEILRKGASDAGYGGPLFICRDHGGPWQRNAELDQALPVEEAMLLARRSFEADIKAGFNYLHIDPTKCPHAFSSRELIQWTVERMDFCEHYRHEIGAGPVDYEVGTEDIKGGLTSESSFEDFLARLTGSLAEKRLPLPTCVVGQTGTLTRLDRNAGSFNSESTARLVNIAADYGIGFKEHNADYLDADCCRIHPEIGISGMNVAPEFGLVETTAYIDLAGMEEKLVQEARLGAGEASGFRGSLERLVMEKASWRKWLTEEYRGWSDDAVRNDSYLMSVVARVCGHYVISEAEMKQACLTMFANIRRFDLVSDPERYVLDRARDVIEHYIHNLQMDHTWPLSIAT